MANLKDLQEMAKNGEVSKKLLENEEFKSELKKALKEENGVETTDEQITQIIKNFEIALQNEEALKVATKTEVSDSELEGIAGGINKAKIIKGAGATVGALLGAVGGLVVGDQISTQTKYHEYKKAFDNESLQSTLASFAGSQNDNEKNEYLSKLRQDVANKYSEYRNFHGKMAVASMSVGAGGGAYGGYKLGKLICKKFDIKD